jgi:hypothetical protein
METCNCWWNKTSWAEACPSTDTDLFKPSDVEGDLLGSVGKGCIIQSFMGEGVGDMRKGIPIGCSSKPCKERILDCARQSPAIGSRSGRPDINTRSQRFLEFKSSVDLICVLDTCIWLTNRVGEVGRCFNITVTVVTNLSEILRACRKTRVETSLVGNLSSKISRTSSECAANGCVQIGLKVHIIDLGVEVDPTSTDDCRNELASTTRRFGDAIKSNLQRPRVIQWI